MRYLVLGISLLSTAVAFGQGRGTYSSVGGFGNVLYPGTGHAPNAPVRGAAGYGQAVGPLGGRNVFANPIPARHPQHGRTIIVPYPVYYGGYAGYPGYDNSQQGYVDPNAGQYNDAPPAVVINQGYVPQQGAPVMREYAPEAPPSQGMRMYEAPTPGAANPRRAVSDDPTVYLIVFKDHSIVQALGYWMENGALHYVSLEHTLNQVSFDLIDRDASQRLNDERGVEFKLPRG